MSAYMSETTYAVRQWCKAVAVSLLLAIGTAVVVSALPPPAHAFLQHLGTGAARYGWLLAIVVVIGACFAKVRGTVIHVVYELGAQRSGWLWMSFGIWLLVLSMVTPTTLVALGVANHPGLYRCLGCLAVAIGLIIRLVTIPRPLRRVPARGVLKSDHTQMHRRDLAPVQIQKLDQLQYVIRNEPAIRSIGLYGGWGTGKSSIYRVCRNEVEWDDPGIVWVEFEPWRYTSQEALTLGFYRAIGDALQSAIPGMQQSAARLLDIADPLVKKHDHTGLLATLAQLLKRRFRTVYDVPEAYISDLLERSDKRLVIVIDDLERMYEASHIFRTLQLIHYLKRSSRTTYIVISEKDKLQQAVPKRYTGTSTEYLEKFVEYELHLPSPEPEVIMDNLQILLSEEGITLSARDSADIANILAADPLSYRGVIKVFNQFISGLKDRLWLGNQYAIRLKDKYAMDYILVKYPALWVHIQHNRFMYLGKLPHNSFLWNSTLSPKGTRAEQVYADEIETTLSGLGLNTERSSHLRHLLADLFPRAYSGSRREVPLKKLLGDRAIAYPDNLDMYFAVSQQPMLYAQQRTLVDDIVKGDSESKRTRLCKAAYGMIAGTDSGSDTVINLLVLLKTAIQETKEPSEARELARAALRAYMSWRGYMNEAQGGELDMVVDICNYVAIHSDDNDATLDYLFEDFEASLPHPTVALSLLLYLRLEASRDFVAADGYVHSDELAERLLHVADAYYRWPSTKSLLDGPEGEWVSLLACWASSGYGDIPKKNAAAQTRRKRVNDRLFRLFEHDDHLLYRMLKLQFFPEPTGRTTVDVFETHLALYDRARLRQRVSVAIKGGRLDEEAQSSLRQFLRDIELASAKT